MSKAVDAIKVVEQKHGGKISLGSLTAFLGTLGWFI